MRAVTGSASGILRRLNVFSKGDSRPSLAVSFEEKVRPLIDLIDELRFVGLDQDLNLPAVVVIGDQSSGKSSILEAISGIQLPRGSGIVTRCPLEMQLKRTSEPGESWKAELKYTTRTNQQRSFSVIEPSELDNLIRNAQNEITGSNRGISNNLITLKVEGTSCPDLTLIDLPGIARTAVDGQPYNVCQQIKDLLKTYTAKKNTIMLCVIPSNVDIAVNEALTIAKEADPQGNRTLGVLTKPDLIDKGTEMEVLAILQNKRFPLKKEYSVVRCRGQKDINESLTLELAIRQEEEFFSNHPIFSTVDEEMRGTKNLARKLTECLVEHIEMTLPHLVYEIEKKYEETTKQLSRMRGAPLDSDQDRRAYLSRTLEQFLNAMNEAIVNGSFVPFKIFPGNSNNAGNDLKECRASFQWRLRFDRLRAEIYSLSGCALGPGGELHESNFPYKLDIYRGPELPRFINFELFKKVVGEHVAKYITPASDCLLNMVRDVQAISDFICDVHYKNIPGIKRHFRQICSEVRQECKNRGNEMIKSEMRKEKLVYTQDETFAEQLAKMQNEEEGYGIRHEAREMHRLLSTYLKVVDRRITDSVPMIIRITLHEDFMERLRERISEAASDKGVLKLVYEEQSVAQRRKMLIDRQSRLKNAIEKINQF